ncbi:MAG: sulfatase-like hydrolase/transferase [Verrucomicrobiota bacterium]
MKRPLLITFSLLLPFSVFAAEKPLNFINIMVDDMGYSDISCMGGEVQTPHIDRLAQTGILFTNYRTYPKCFPTRDAIMTGMDAPPVRLPADGVTIAEALKPAGYRTYFVGKTHGAVMDNFIMVPKRGFDRSFGNEDGGSYWDHRVKQTMLDGKPWHTEKPFFKSDTHTDFAIQFLSEHDTSKPFFLHLAYHAPHYPIHSKQADTKKYTGKFLAGPSVMRKQRFARMQEMGILPANAKLSPDFSEMEQAWEALPAEKKEYYDLIMAGYCGMIDNVDQNIGRVLAQLEKMGVRENTVIFFSSDNGGCAEGGNNNWPGEKTERFGHSYDYSGFIGGPTTHIQVGAAWANYSNTPFRKFKNDVQEGGLSVPFIIHAPSVIKEAGRISREPVMVMDVMPTILDLARVPYPEKFGERVLKPMQGLSLQPYLAGGKVDLDRPIHLFFNRNFTLIKYPWKLIVSSKGNAAPELYDLENDRSELNNLAGQMPEKVAELQKVMMEYREGMPLDQKAPKIQKN